MADTWKDRRPDRAEIQKRRHEFAVRAARQMRVRRMLSEVDTENMTDNGLARLLCIAVRDGHVTSTVR